MRIVVVSGGFDPIHAGHIAYFREASRLGDILVAGVNSDDWLTRKKGKPFMSFDDRIAVVSSIKYVNYALRFDDSDDSAVKLLEEVKRIWPPSRYEICVANGGDRTNLNNREESVKDVKFIFGVGGFNKMNSSSDILRKWTE